MTFKGGTLASGSQIPDIFASHWMGLRNLSSYANAFCNVVSLPRSCANFVAERSRFSVSRSFHTAADPHQADVNLSVLSNPHGHGSPLSQLTRRHEWKRLDSFVLKAICRRKRQVVRLKPRNLEIRQGMKAEDLANQRLAN